MRPLPSSARRSRPLLAAAVLIAVSAITVPATASLSQTGAARAIAAKRPAITLALAQPSPDLPGLPPVSRDLSRIEVDSPAFRRAAERYQTVADALAAGQARRAGIDHTLADLASREAELQAGIASGRGRLAGLRDRLGTVDRAIADLAIALYTTGGSGARVDAALATEQPSVNDADRRDVLGSASLDVLLAERRAHEARITEVRRRLSGAGAEARTLGSRIAELRAERPDAAAAELQAAPPVATERVAYEGARTLATVEGADFPLVALDAYYRAAEVTADVDPSCRIQWWAIAGIARVEGHHGSYGSSSLDEVGNTAPPIIGIPLDGNNETQVVRDTDDGALDGDTVFDRAVGPMQFIPQTWNRFATDGNDDGVATPFNMYDATRTASRYLCRASGQLNADPGLRSAYFSYNHSLEYVDRVLSFARMYERVVDVPEPSA